MLVFWGSLVAGMLYLAGVLSGVLGVLGLVLPVVGVPGLGMSLLFFALGVMVHLLSRNHWEAQRQTDYLHTILQEVSRRSDAHEAR
mgnify:CR=1 FL=1